MIFAPVSQQPRSVQMISAWAAVAASKAAAANNIDFMYHFLFDLRDYCRPRSDVCSMKPKICPREPNRRKSAHRGRALSPALPAILRAKILGADDDGGGDRRNNGDKVGTTDSAEE
jgi:hypothetical protein